ncbi:hypothetical protein [Pantoea eucalypti]|uniref:hypothetical protein n=1 Tax=Pantoea eucalypti TaxID=470933 RepID=UPI001115FDDD|nr:hypothetical protein [Pantoea eucalypti]
MNKKKTEEMLLKEGFTQKEVSVIRQHADKNGYPYPWLLSQLKKRFIAAMILIAILLAGLIYTIRSGTQENLVSYSITLLAGFTILYIFIPLKPAYKAFKFLRKHSHIL